MRAIAIALANELLARHARTCAPNRAIAECVVTYGDLCRDAGCPEMTKSVGSFLGEVATWCHERGFPPLNSLAVNGDTGMPGEGYDTAAECSLVEWHDQVRNCIDFRGYPPAV